jgi:hypothetical protein
MAGCGRDQPRLPAVLNIIALAIVVAGRQCGNNDVGI